MVDSNPRKRKNNNKPPLIVFTKTYIIINKQICYNFFKYFISILIIPSVLCLFTYILYYPNYNSIEQMFSLLIIGTLVNGFISILVHSLSLLFYCIKCKPGKGHFPKFLYPENFFIISSILVILFLCLLHSNMIPDTLNILDTRTYNSNLVLISLISIVILIITITRNLHINYKFDFWFFRVPFLSYDVYLSKRIKETVRINDSELALKQKNTGIVVKIMNLANLITSIIIFAVFTLMADKDMVRTNSLFFIVISFIIVRTISRCSEIIYAFYIDTMYPKKDHDKNTNLRPVERVGLAILSMIEITFLFAPIYLYFYLLLPENNKALKFGHNIISLFYSFGITTYKSIDFTKLSRSVCIVIVLHVITSMTLTVFTLARYISEIKSGNEK